MTLWDDREFRKLWLARLISTAGSAVSGVALPVLVYSLTGSAAYTGFAVSAALVRMIVRPLNLTRRPRTSLRANLPQGERPGGA